METRADFVLIGTFTVSIIVGVFLFVLWFAQVEAGREWSEYDVVFDTAVTGLSEAGDVRFSGIKVGEVQRLSIDPEDPGRVIARVRVDATTPVTEDSEATLEFQGLTGVAYIQLAGGTARSQPLETAPGDDVPKIYAEVSGIQELFASAPDVLSGANRVLLQAENLLGPQNQKYISDILSDVNALTSTLAKHDEDIDQIFADLKVVSSELASISGNINTMSQNLSELSVNANRIIEEDAEAILSDLKIAANQAGELAENANGILSENRAAIRNFANGGLAQFGLFVVEGRQLVKTLDRVLQRMESNPAGYLFGADAVEYQGE